MRTETGTVDFNTWQQLLTGISRQEQHRLVQIRLKSEALGSRVLVQGLRLIGLSLEQKGAEADALKISVGGGQAGEPHLCHVVPAPVRIVTTWDRDGRLRTLEIEQQSGTRTEITLCS